jgi:hypothetical protein
MRVFKKKPAGLQVNRSEALDSKPVKNHQITEGRLDSGEIIIHYPVTMRPWIAGLVERFGGPSERTLTKQLQLDKLGTEVWELIDGRRSVRRIIKLFADHHRLQIREAEVAVTQFIRQLGQHGLIGMR